MENVII